MIRETAPPSKRKIGGIRRSDAKHLSPRVPTWDHMGYAHEIKRRRLESPWKPGNLDFFFSLLDRLIYFKVTRKILKREIPLPPL